MIESMAAGTPVIALRRGSVPEIVIDGVIGYICDIIAEMVDAVGQVDQLDPALCPQHAATFDVATMCHAYERMCRTRSEHDIRALQDDFAWRGGRLHG